MRKNSGSTRNTSRTTSAYTTGRTQEARNYFDVIGVRGQMQSDLDRFAEQNGGIPSISGPMWNVDGNISRFDKAVHGTQDEYTRGVREIIKKHKL